MEEMSDHLTLLEGYGITECSPVLTLTHEGEPRIGVGRPIEGVELKIVHPETHEPQPLGTRGLILAHGPNIFAGYLNPGIEPPFLILDGKQWYKTGDLGFLDEKGNLTISGRMKRFIKVGPEMVSLASIEDALLQIAQKKGWPLEHEGPSLAVCAKEQESGKPKIALFCKFNVSVDEVNKNLKEAGFSNLVRISNVQQLEEIPIMGTGKINYRALESQYM
jgi:long-chain-fatty-acid--[acyl-carrier-protein] ligase